MGFGTNIPGHILIGDDDIVFGTVMLGNTFGEIIKCDLDRTANEIEIEKANGGLRALILANPHFMLDLETQFSSNVTAPALGDPVTFPLAGVIGRITGIKPGWEAKGSRKLSIKAGHWDSMAVETGVGTGIYTNPAFKVALDGTATAIT
jgi:hypothetical protein